MRRLSPGELDTIAGRLEEIGLEDERLRSKLREQVEEFGFTLRARINRSDSREHFISSRSPAG